MRAGDCAENFITDQGSNLAEAGFPIRARVEPQEPTNWETDKTSDAVPDTDLPEAAVASDVPVTEEQAQLSALEPSPAAAGKNQVTEDCLKPELKNEISEEVKTSFVLFAKTELSPVQPASRPMS